MKMIVSFTEIFNKLPQKIKTRLLDLEYVPQSPAWHPEGDTLIHTIIVYNRAIMANEYDLAIAAIFHDLGKKDTLSKNNKGEWAAHAHEKVSYKLCKQYEDWINKMTDGEAEKVCAVVKHHMRIKQIDKMREVKRRALENYEYYDDLQKFTKFDSMRNLTINEKYAAEAIADRIKQ